MKDLESILSHPKILNVSMLGNKIVIDTSDLIITDARDVEYYGGKFKIFIDLQANNVTFDSTEKHGGYWTEHDPHPHVSGRSGQACFGNVETTLIQLISDLELYAVTMMCLNFLQSANNDDPAGQNIRRWSRWVDGEICPPDYDYDQCWNCGCDMEDEAYTVYESIYIDEDGDIEYGNEVVVCEDCRENDFHWSEEFEVYYGDRQDDRTICDYCHDPINSSDMEYIYSWVQVDLDNNDECEVSDDVDYYCHHECAHHLRQAQYCEEAEVYAVEVEYIGGEEE